MAIAAMSLAACGAGIEPRQGEAASATTIASPSPEAPATSGGNVAPPGTPEATLISSVEQTDATDSGRYEMVIVYDVANGSPDFPISEVRAVGEFADGGRRVHVSLDAGAGGTVDEIVIDGTVYISTQGLCQSIDASEYLDALSAGAGNATDPTSLLDVLAGVSGVTDEGRLDIRGVGTSHLSGTFTVRDAIGALAAEPAQALSRLFTDFPESFMEASQQVDVFVDDDGLLRRMQTASPAVDIGGGTVPPYTTIVDYFDFGAEPSIEAPADCDDAGAFGGSGTFEPIGPTIN